MDEARNISQESVIDATNHIVNSLKEEYSGTLIEFENFSYNVFQFEGGINIDLTLELLFDGEPSKRPFTIRFFNTEELFESEKSMYQELERRLENIENIALEKAIMLDKENCRIIYEGGNGIGISEIDELYSDFLLGTISSIIHGDSVSDLNFAPLLGTFELLLKNIPFTNEDKEKLKEIIGERFDGNKKTYSGYLPLTQLPREKIKLEIMTPIEELDLYALSKLIGIKVTIPMRSPQFEVKDRLSDLGVYFAAKAFDNYLETENLDKIKESLESYISGYSSSLYERSSVRLKDLYPNGLTVDLQLVLNVWIEEATAIDIENVDNERLKKLVEFTEIVLDPKFTFELLLSET